MRKNIFYKYILFILLILLFEISFIIKSQTNGGERLLMDFGWRFAFGHPFDTEKDFNHATGYFSYFAKAGYGDGPASKDFDDRVWRKLDLPHDWAVELPFDGSASHSHGYKTVGPGFPETSIGWYRKTFFIPESDLGKRISVEFDGVFRNSIVWVNGHYLGNEPSGYSSFQYDITDLLNYGNNNVISIRVDATMEEGWFYEGAGIYRHVWLTKTNPLHIVPYGIFVTSEVNHNTAKITARTTVIDKRTNNAAFNIRNTIINVEGNTLITRELENIILKPDNINEYVQNLNISEPKLWSVESPYLHTLITEIILEGTVVDRVETTFGIRTVRFDPDEGFFLNEKHLKLKGTNNHQDHAGVGTAIPDALQEFRIARLKEMGCNAYRCSHNPPTPELLDACDRLGMLVIDENRLMGTTPELLEQLKRMIIRDRNHPSVIIWSLGNEEWAIEGNITGARIASTMQEYAWQFDSTRRITVASSGGWDHGVSSVIDVMGYNYIIHGNTDEHHKKFPNQPGIGTEESTTQGTRGVYIDNWSIGHMAPSDRRQNGSSIEKGWKYYYERPYLAGLFYWTGFDYRGESNPFNFPAISSQFGIIDVCGFPKDPFYYLKAWWTDEPVLHIMPHWNLPDSALPADRRQAGWQGREEDTINVRVHSNCDEVELFLNNESLGRKEMEKNSHLEWNVKYEPGILIARGYKDGKEIITEQIETSGEPTSIILTPYQPSIKADGEDISVITVQVNDSKGNMVPTAGNEITFSIDGPGNIIGIGNGNPSSHEPDKYIEDVSLVKIESLKLLEVSDLNNRKEVDYDFNDSNWPDAFPKTRDDKWPPEETVRYIIIRGIFKLPEITENITVRLLAKSLGEEQEIYINGHLIEKSMKRDDPNQVYLLDNSILRKGKNVYAIAGTPLVKRYRWDNLNTDPGIIQVTIPAGTWKRCVFNGLAQVIVQSTKEFGTITLTATSPGLTTGILKLNVEPATPRPSVPTD